MVSVVISHGGVGKHFPQYIYCKTSQESPCKLRHACTCIALFSFAEAPIRLDGIPLLFLRTITVDFGQSFSNMGLSRNHYVLTHGEYIEICLVNK